MKKNYVILKLLNQNSFISYNVDIAKKVGINEAILFGKLVALYEYFEYQEFYFEQARLTEETGLSKFQIQKACENLVKCGLLTVKRKGLPCKNWYDIDIEFLTEFLKVEETEQQEVEKLDNKELSIKKVRNLTSNNKETELSLNKRLDKKIINSKSHCVSDETPIGEHTQKEKSDFQKLKERWWNNYQTLFNQGRVNTSQPIVEWARVGKHIRQVLQKYGLEVCINALDKAMTDSFALSNGYSLTTVLSASCINKYINGRENQSYSRIQHRDLNNRLDISGLAIGYTGQVAVQPQYDLSAIAFCENNQEEAVVF